MKYSPFVISALVALGGTRAWAQSATVSSVIVVSSGAATVTPRIGPSTGNSGSGSNPTYVGNSLAGMAFVAGNAPITGDTGDLNTPASPASDGLFTLTAATYSSGTSTVSPTDYAFMGYGIDPAITAAAGTPVDTYADISTALYSYQTPPASGTSAGSYSGLTWASDDLGLPTSSVFYTIHHRTGGPAPGDYFAVIYPQTSQHSTVYDLKPMSYQGGSAATNMTGGNAGYSSLTYVSGSIGTGYASNSMYYLRQDGSGNTQFGQMIPALTGGSSDFINLTTAVGSFSSFGTGNNATLTWATGAVGSNAANLFYYLRQDASVGAGGTGNTILGVLNPSLTSGVRTISDISNLGGVFNSITFVAGATGPSAGEWGTSNYFYVSGSVATNHQSVNFAAISDQTLTSTPAPFTVTPTASSGLAITLTVASGSTGTATISGPDGGGHFTVTPTGGGIVTLKANQAGNGSYAANFLSQSFNVIGVPLITSGTSASGTAGSSFSYTTVATGSPTSYGASNLPAGLSVNTSTGVITGTPTTAGTSTVTLTAVNGHGTSVPVTLTITITAGAPPPPSQAITSASTATATIGKAFAFQITTTGTPVSTTATSLPAGLVVNASTGAITGTPTTIGVSVVSVTVQDINGSSATQQLTITVAAAATAPVITSAASASATAGASFSYTIVASGSPTSYSATGLPAGLSLNTATGVIAGTPTTAGVSTVTLTATNAIGVGQASPLTITTAAAAVVTLPPVIIPVSAPGAGPNPGTVLATIGTPFPGYQITASGSPTSYFAVGLPPGLTLNTQTGLITGTPTTAGTNVATLSATNAGGTSTITVIFVIGTPLSVAVASDLVNAVTTADANPNNSYTITFTGSVTLGAGNTLPAISTSGVVTINGANFTLDGGGVQRGFLVTAGTVIIENLTIQNTIAQGGNGAGGGGGGLGAGGALYIAPGTNVTVSNVNFGTTGKPNQAQGGNGGGAGTNGGAGGSMGIAGSTGGTAGNGVIGGAGAFGAGGGGSNGFSGGAGGNGGGGGNSAGLGGFGGGNGSATGTSTSSGLGGGGLGAGGAIFAAGNLTISGPITVNGNKVTAGTSGGTGAVAGSAYGAGIFLSGNDSSNGGTAGSLIFVPIAGQTDAIADVIADQAGSGGTGGQSGIWGLVMNGAGILNLTGANSLSGTVTINNGILAVNNTSGSGTGLGPVTVTNGGTVTGSGKIGSNLAVQAGSFFAPGTGIGTLSVGGSVTWSGTSEGIYTLSNDNNSSSLLAITGALTKSGSGTYVFNMQNTGAAPDTYTLATFGSTNFVASNFSYIGLPSGLAGTFTVSGTQLQFAVVPATVPTGATNAPVITSSSAASGTSGTAFTYSITATNTPTSYGMAGTLPTGLTLNTNTGVISGTPTQTGTFVTTIGASNAAGSGTSAFTLTMAAAPVATIASPAPASSGGGGGAPSYWFYLAVALLLAIRLALRRDKKYSV